MSVEIVSLQCPVCGAPFAPNDEKCGYCGSILVLRTDHPKINPATLNRHVIDKRIAEYRQDLKRDHSDTTAHYGLGVAYFNLGLTDDSIRELEDAARLMPENASIQSQLAVVLKEALDEGRPGAAAKLRDRIDYTLRLDPDNFDAMILKAETDPKLSRYQSIELLEEVYKSHPERPPAKLIAALSQLAMSDKFLGDGEIDLLRRAYQNDNDSIRKPLFTAVLRRAKALSGSSPEADVEDPRRNSKAMDLWKELSIIDGVRACEELVRYMLFTEEMTKSDKRKIQALARNPTTNATSSSASEPKLKRSTASIGFPQYLKAILIGLLKALGVLTAIFILFAIVLANTSSGSTISTVVAAIFGLGLVILPLLFPVREVKKMKKRPADNSTHALAPMTPKVAPQARHLGIEQYSELLNILKKYFLERWKRQSALRITTDSSRSGVRGERLRNKTFLASLTK